MRPRRAECRNRWALTAAGLYLAAISQSYAPALRWMGQQPLLVGEIIAAMLIQAVPLTMLAAITPVILQHGHDGRGAGKRPCWPPAAAAASPGRWPRACWPCRPWGWRGRFALLAALLTAAAMPAIWQGRRRLAGAGGGCHAGRRRMVLAAANTQRPGRVTLRPIGGPHHRGGQAVADRRPAADRIARGAGAGDALRYGYLLELALAMRPGTETALVVGLGGGLAPRVLAMHGVRCESVEIDPAVVEIAHRDFGFTGSVTLGDGRAVLARDRRRSICFCWTPARPTGCRGTSSPWRPCDLTRQRLNPAGMLAIQFIGDDGPWSASLVRTAAAALGRPHCTLLAGRGPRPGRHPLALRRPRRGTAIARQRQTARSSPILAATRSAVGRLVAHGRPLSGRACLGRERRPVGGGSAACGGENTGLTQRRQDAKVCQSAKTSQPPPKRSDGL